MRELFVYYRVRPVTAAAACVLVQRLHAALREDFPTLQARLLCREDTSGELQTWMETYAIDGGVSTELQARIDARAQALLPMIEGERHTEVFAPCAS